MDSKFFQGLTVVFFCVCSVFTGWAQDSAFVKPLERNDQPYISWVSQYPVHKEKVKQNVIRRTYTFLVGKSKENELARPVAVLASNPSSFWVLDQGKQTIYNVENNNGEIPRSIRKKENYFTSLVGSCAMPDGGMLFTDSRLNKVFRVTGEDNKLEVVNDTLHLLQPTGVAYSDLTKEIWIVETGAHRITILDENGALKKRIGGRGDESAKFNYPTSICIDKKGDAYIVDAMNFRVQIFDKNGTFQSMFGEAGDMMGAMARPKGIAVDSYGDIYIADALLHAVQIFDKQGTLLYSFGKRGRDKEEFWMPAGVYIDSRDFIYVADSYNSRIQIFQLIYGGG
jgi:DNA-binding beta-propeller fold protein YncE